jgi:hypothetical protein
MLKKGSYQVGSTKIQVLSIAYENETHIKAKLAIMEGKYLIDKIKWYKLEKERIKHWINPDADRTEEELEELRRQCEL